MAHFEYPYLIVLHPIYILADPGHMTKMVATPIYSKKNIKNLLLQSQCADCNEIWYVASSLGAS